MLLWALLLKILTSVISADSCTFMLLHQEMKIEDKNKKKKKSVSVFVDIATDEEQAHNFLFLSVVPWFIVGRKIQEFQNNKI